MAGERAVYKRRAEQAPQEGAPQQKPKLLRFVMDLSGSMYYFVHRPAAPTPDQYQSSVLRTATYTSGPRVPGQNNHDRRLERCLQSAVMLFEAFSGFEHKYSLSMVGHSGETACAPLVEYGALPANEKERLQLVQRMAAHTQFCESGDHTLEATREAIAEVASHADADERFVFLFRRVKAPTHP